MPEAANQQVLLAENPTGKLHLDHFRLQDAPMPVPAEGEVLLRVRYLSLDAASRAWMQGATYRDALDAGMLMAGHALAEVVESRAPEFAPGDLVLADTGWQQYAAMPARELRKVPRLEPLTHLLGVYGIAGITAYFGLLEIGQPKAGETVVVSAAAGSVGSIASQIARIKGARVVGIAGGAAKCEVLTRELGLDAAVDYKSDNFYRELKQAAPGGIDVYFDNVGGDIFEACLFQMNLHGRIVCCGAVSQYDGKPPAHGPRGVPGLIVTKRLRVQGFILYDFLSRAGEALADLQEWVGKGQLKAREDIIEGLENAPRGLIGLLAGENIGKRMVHVS